jgi:hypothetical protein
MTNVIYDMGGKFDKSFNQAAYDGAERWKKETGKPYLEFEISNPAQREQAKRRMAERGATPIVGIGFSAGQQHGEGGQGLPQAAVRHHRHRWSSCPTCRASSSRSTKAASWSA